MRDALSTCQQKEEGGGMRNRGRGEAKRGSGGGGGGRLRLRLVLVCVVIDMGQSWQIRRVTSDYQILITNVPHPEIRVHLPHPD